MAKKRGSAAVIGLFLVASLFQSKGLLASTGAATWEIRCKGDADVELRHAGGAAFTAGEEPGRHKALAKMELRRSEKKEIESSHAKTPVRVTLGNFILLFRTVCLSRSHRFADDSGRSGSSG
jgi:hypothetical protein